MKVVIVGGVAGGATAAARIRRLDEQAEIIVFERTGYCFYEAVSHDRTLIQQALDCGMDRI